ncbi:MAG TPA: DUF6804 family protein [Capsulimonadaceae bacterium]|nr:DUF6804 family protein [Capsulimonadaceae bacterium]
MNAWRLFSTIALAGAAWMLFVAWQGREPYLWYQNMRWVVCIATAFSAYAIYRNGHAIWVRWVPVVMLLAVAFLFNPLIPFRYTRLEWQRWDERFLVVILVSIGITAYVYWQPGLSADRAAFSERQREAKKE